ncbi:MAG: response regulator [Firmicutes bacterium]|nr:response regulator [Bacillota bacterium]
MKKILIIEDHRELASQMRTYLERGGYGVETAGSYYDALDKLDIGCDLALLDINLPDKDGYHLIERGKQKDVRVIITMVKNDESFIVKAFDQGGGRLF